MRGRFAPIIAVAAAVMPAGSLAMSATGVARFGACTVVGADNLPKTSGGSEGLCRSIERAIKAQAPTAQYRVEVRVISSSRLAAELVVNGHTLPEQRFAVMDGELRQGSIDRFAQSLALAVGEAAKP